MSIRVRLLANKMTRAVNENVDCILKVSTGYTIDDSGQQIPSYESQPVELQLQSMSTQDLAHLDFINLLHGKTSLSALTFNSHLFLQKVKQKIRDPSREGTPLGTPTGNHWCHLGQLHQVKLSPPTASTHHRQEDPQ